MPRQEKNSNQINQESLNEMSNNFDFLESNLYNISNNIPNAIDSVDFDLDNLPSLKLTRNHGKIYGRISDSSDYF